MGSIIVVLLVVVSMILATRRKKVDPSPFESLTMRFGAMVLVADHSFGSGLGHCAPFFGTPIPR
jgi:hypothetical protein